MIGEDNWQPQTIAEVDLATGLEDLTALSEVLRARFRDIALGAVSLSSEQRANLVYNLAGATSLVLVAVEEIRALDELGTASLAPAIRSTVHSEPLSLVPPVEEKEKAESVPEPQATPAIAPAPPSTEKAAEPTQPVIKKAATPKVAGTKKATTPAKKAAKVETEPVFTKSVTLIDETGKPHILKWNEADLKIDDTLIKGGSQKSHNRNNMLAAVLKAPGKEHRNLDFLPANYTSARQIAISQARQSLQNLTVVDNNDNNVQLFPTVDEERRHSGFWLNPALKSANEGSIEAKAPESASAPVQPKTESTKEPQKAAKASASETQSLFTHETTFTDSTGKRHSIKWNVESLDIDGQRYEDGSQRSQNRNKILAALLNAPEKTHRNSDFLDGIYSAAQRLAISTAKKEVEQLTVTDTDGNQIPLLSTIDAKDNSKGYRLNPVLRVDGANKAELIERGPEPAISTEAAASAIVTEEPVTPAKDAVKTEEVTATTEIEPTDLRKVEFLDESGKAHTIEWDDDMNLTIDGVVIENDGSERHHHRNRIIIESSKHPEQVFRPLDFNDIPASKRKDHLKLSTTITSARRSAGELIVLDDQGSPLFLLCERLNDEGAKGFGINPAFSFDLPSETVAAATQAKSPLGDGSQEGGEQDFLAPVISDSEGIVAVDEKAEVEPDTHSPQPLDGFTLNFAGVPDSDIEEVQELGTDNSESDIQTQESSTEIVPYQLGEFVPAKVEVTDRSVIISGCEYRVRSSAILATFRYLNGLNVGVTPGEIYSSLRRRGNRLEDLPENEEDLADRMFMLFKRGLLARLDVGNEASSDRFLKDHYVINPDPEDIKRYKVIVNLGEGAEDTYLDNDDISILGVLAAHPEGLSSDDIIHEVEGTMDVPKERFDILAKTIKKYLVGIEIIEKIRHGKRPHFRLFEDVAEQMDVILAAWAEVVENFNNSHVLPTPDESIKMLG